MLRQIVVATAFGCLMHAVNVSAAPLTPTGKWVVDYRDDQCLASRTFGTTDHPISLGVRPAINGETYLLIVARKHAGPQPSAERKGAVDFGNGPIKSWLLEYQSKPAGMDLFQFRISAREMDQAKTALHLKLSPGNSPDIDVTLGMMPSLIKVLEDCTDNLRSYWNVNGEKEGKISTPAKGDVRKVFNSDDYPQEAMDRDQRGSSQLILLIDEGGKVAGCDVLSPSGIPALDIMGCQVIRERAKFSPALDGGGKPVRSTVVTPPIVWSIEP
jgi:TonB family protein